MPDDAPPPQPSRPAQAGEPTPLLAAFTLGPYQTNCYVVSVPGDPGCWIVDASFDPEPLIDHIRSQALIPQLLLLTHAHVDHIAGVTAVRRAFPDLPICIHPAEEAWLSDPLLNLSQLGGFPVTAPGPDRLLEHGQRLHLAGTTWNILHTPGHSPGGVTFVHEPSRTAIVGDALFAGSIGRTDFPGSDHETLIRSIRTRLFALPPETRIYPGHGPPTTIGRERSVNPFVRDVQPR